MDNSSSVKKFKLSSKDNPFSKLLPVIFLFVFAAVFIPAFGSVFLFLLPTILFLNGTVNGANRTLFIFLITFSILVCITVLFKLDIPVMAVFTIGAAAIFMTKMAVRNYSIEKTIIGPALVIIGAISFYFISDALALQVNPWQLVKNYITLLVEENVNLYGKLPLQAEDINFIKDNEQNIINGLTQIFPSMVVILSVMMIWVNLLLGRNYLSRAGIIFPKLAVLARWKIPEKIIWIFIVSGALLFVDQKDISFFSVNVFIITCFAYFLHGLAIVSFFFQIKKVPLFFRYIFYFLIAVQQILMIPIIAAGLFDIWFDFRKLFQKNQTTN